MGPSIEGRILPFICAVGFAFERGAGFGVGVRSMEETSGASAVAAAELLLLLLLLPFLSVCGFESVGSFGSLFRLHCNL